MKTLASLQGRLDCQKFTLDVLDICYVCPLAKQKRLPFVSHHHMPEFPFDLIHCDVWGPFHTSTVHEQSYFLTIVDDFTCFTWVFLMQHKSEAPSVVTRFYHMIETQLHSKIKAIRTDNAKELAFTDLVLLKGIIRQFSCVQRPEQNSVVERKHQHLLKVARSLYFQSRVPIQFWGECVLTATYLIIRTPSPQPNHKAPYELLYNKSFDYSTLKVFINSYCFEGQISTSITVVCLLGLSTRHEGLLSSDLRNICVTRCSVS